MSKFNYWDFTQFIYYYLSGFENYLSSESVLVYAGRERIVEFLYHLDDNEYTSFMKRWFAETGYGLSFQPSNDVELGIYKFHCQFLSAYLSYVDEKNFDDFAELMSLARMYQCQYPSVRYVFSYYVTYISDNFMEVQNG